MATTGDRIRADLILIHAPSVYDFRERDDMLFAYLSDSSSVNITTIFEMYPLGFLSLKQHLGERGLQVKIVNLASLMLMHPQIDVRRLIARLEAPVFGIDLHWMAHCHGSIEVAKEVKAVHPDATVIFGGISATYYAQELIRYPAVDVVVQGFDTLEPVTRLVQVVKSGSKKFENIPNLIYKGSDDQIRSSGFTHKPAGHYNDVAIDWSYFEKARTDPLTSKLIMTLPNSGCAHECGWCGGSGYAVQRIMDVKRTLVFKDNQKIISELNSMSGSAHRTSIYALQCYSEPESRLTEYLEAVRRFGYRAVSFEMFNLPGPELMKKMSAATRASILLSPESHDQQVSRLAGRGNYSMQELETWIPAAFDAGIENVIVWFFIGMPGQTRQSVIETAEYSERLMEKFPDGRVIPLICPMVPFLDPGSKFFEEPGLHGYRVFYRSLEEHRQAMISPLWSQRLNYETRWMSRREIQDVMYEAVGRLVAAKRDLGLLPTAYARNVLELIRETTLLLKEVEDALRLDGQFPPDLRCSILNYNRRIFAASRDQLVPVSRQFGGRWFDDFTVPEGIIAAVRQA